MREIKEKYNSVIAYGFGSRLMQLLEDLSLDFSDIVDGNSLRWGQTVIIHDHQYTYKISMKLMLQKMLRSWFALIVSSMFLRYVLPFGRNIKNDIVIL